MSDFKFTAPRMPTPEEHRAVSLRWLARIRPTLIDQWPAEVAALSMPTKFVSVPDGLVKELWDMHDGEQPGPLMNELAAALDGELGWKPRFIRLNSRSPKDRLWPFEAPITMSGKEAVGMMVNSERVLDDLLEFKYVPEQQAFVCLRDVVYDMAAKREYRCFVKDSELIAVTHYDYQNPISAPSDGGKELRNAINEWFAANLKPVLHLDTVVFDLLARRDGKFLLIEINPYGLSDPCHFGTYENVENASSFIQFGAPIEQGVRA